MRFPRHAAVSIILILAVHGQGNHESKVDGSKKGHPNLVKEVKSVDEPQLQIKARIEDSKQKLKDDLPNEKGLKGLNVNDLMAAINGQQAKEPNREGKPKEDPSDRELERELADFVKENPQLKKLISAQGTKKEGENNPQKAKDSDTLNIGALLQKAFPKAGKGGIPQLNDLPVEAIGSLMKQMKNVPLEKFLSPCKQDLAYTIKNGKEEWALRMLDSFGKPSAGIMKGGINWNGDFDECVTSIAPLGNGSQGFKGKYCWTLWELRIKGDKTVMISSGICVPDSCKAQELFDMYPFIKSSIDDQIGKLDLGIEEAVLSGLNCQITEESMTAGQVFCLFILISLSTLLVMGTALDEAFFQHSDKSDEYNLLPLAKHTNDSSALAEKNDLHQGRAFQDSNYQNPSFVLGFLLCFSVIRNTRSIFKKESQNSETQFSFLHGFRVICVLWVILGHVVMNGITVIENPIDALDSSKEWKYQFIAQANYSVDCFFLMSGFLLSYYFLKNHKMLVGASSWVWYYLHRYIRLTPPMLLMMLFTSTLMLRIADGPNWPNMATITKKCQDVLPFQILYLHNFVMDSKDCAAWTWYLANEWQFYVISPLFLQALMKAPGVAIPIIVAIILGSNILTYIISYVNGYLTTVAYLDRFIDEPVETSELMEELSFNMYIKPYCRISPYLVGILLGYVYFQTGNRKVHISKPKQVLFWCLSLIAMHSCVFGLYNQEATVHLAAYFHSFARTVWACSIFWVIYACLNNYGGYLQRFLSLDFWYPLSRLSYSNYLVHPLLMYYYFYSAPDTLYFTDATLTVIYLGIVVISYVLAFCFCLLCEAPFIKLERFVRTGQI